MILPECVTRKFVLSLTLIFLSNVSTFAQQPQITLVNMIPKALSYESNQDSEPNLAVNPANVNHMAGSAFTPGRGFCGPDAAPIFISVNGGNTWATNCIVPSNTTGRTEDITLRFGGSSNTLYAGILRLPRNNFFQYRMNILRTSDFRSPEMMKVLVDRDGVDQPYLQASSVGTNDRVYVGDNDFTAPNRQSATVDHSLNSGVPSPTFDLSRVEARTTDRQNGPATRLAIHSDGTLYAVFYGWRSVVGDFGGWATITTDVVVVRDNNGASGTVRFADLKDNDGLPGVRIVRDRKLPWYSIGPQPSFGNERFVASNLSIAVDPRSGKSSTVYVAWADRLATDDYTLHLRRSTDSGVTWSADLKTITNATNPALAINSEGTVAFLYQQLTSTSDHPRWDTHIELTTNDAAFSSGQNYTLATVRADKPDPRGVPYLGDYVHIMAVGKNFYGVFSANNTPDNANFPTKVIYQRNANFGTRQLFSPDNSTEVPPSIDPFFFKVIMP